MNAVVSYGIKVDRPIKPRYPRPEEKAILRELGFNPKHFLTIAVGPDCIEYLETQTGKRLPIRY